MKVENKLKFFNLLGHRILLVSNCKHSIQTPQKQNTAASIEYK